MKQIWTRKKKLVDWASEYYVQISKAYNAQTCTSKTYFHFKTALYLILCNLENNKTLNNLTFLQTVDGVERSEKKYLQFCV